jgi:hypothetical protein
MSQSQIEMELSVMQKAAEVVDVVMRGFGMSAVICGLPISGV